MNKVLPRRIEVWADWLSIGAPKFMGVLVATRSRAKEIFSFEYAVDWLKSPHAQSLDPSLVLFGGTQYAPSGQDNFALFLDSCPDRWGRLLMRRREAQAARELAAIGDPKAIPDLRRASNKQGCLAGRNAARQALAALER